MLHYTKPPRNRRLSANSPSGSALCACKRVWNTSSQNSASIALTFLVSVSQCTDYHVIPQSPFRTPDHTSIHIHISSPLRSPFREYEYLLKQFAFLNLVADQGDCDAINICSCPANNRLQTGILSVSFFKANVSVRSAIAPGRSPPSVLGIR